MLRTIIPKFLSPKDDNENINNNDKNYDDDDENDDDIDNDNGIESVFIIHDNENNNAIVMKNRIPYPLS